MEIWTVKSRIRVIAGMLSFPLFHAFSHSLNASGMPFPAIIPIVKPDPKTRFQPEIPLGDGILVRLFGSRWDGIRIERNGKTIFERMIGDGAIDMKFQKVAADGSHYNVAARHGNEKDLYVAYAIRGDNVIQSMPYRNTVKGDTFVPSQWIGPNVLEIGSRQPAMLAFDPVENRWSFTPMECIQVSHDLKVELFDNFRGIRIAKGGSKLLDSLINDGPIGVSFQNSPSSTDDFNFAIRYGKDRDVYMTYALVSGRLIGSPVYRVSHAELNAGFGVPSEWVATNVLEIGSSRRGRLSFDAASTKWVLEEKPMQEGKPGLDFKWRVMDPHDPLHH